MSLESIEQPIYFHRDYQNDVKMPNSERTDQSWLSLSQRVAFASLPFLSLYKPFSFPIALTMGSVRVLTSASELYAATQRGDTQEISEQMLQTSIAVAALAGTILAHPLGMLVTTGQDIIVDCGHLIHALNEGDYKVASEKTLSLVNNALYLGLFFTGALELSIASLSIQVISGLYHSSEDFKNGRWIEGSAHLLMVAMRVNQLKGQVQTLQLRNEIERNMMACVKEVSQKETPESSNIATADVNKSVIYAAYSVSIVNSGGFLFHVADYRDGSRVVTCLDGGMRGYQSVYLNGRQVNSSSNVTWYQNYFVHYYQGGKIHSYVDRQITEIY